MKEREHEREQEKEEEEVVVGCEIRRDVILLAG